MRREASGVRDVGVVYAVPFDYTETRGVILRFRIASAACRMQRRGAGVQEYSL